MACLVKGKMDSYGMFSRRVVETETPVMVQVLKFESPCSYPQLGFHGGFSLDCIWEVFRFCGAEKKSVL